MIEVGSLARTLAVTTFAALATTACGSTRVTQTTADSGTIDVSDGSRADSGADDMEPTDGPPGPYPDAAVATEASVAACKAETALVSGGLTAVQKKKAEMLTSIWENSTTNLQYGYCQDIMDDRGYTCGRAGFCTGCGDLVEVVDCFNKKFGTGPQNLLAKYLPALKNGDDTPQIDAIGPFAGSPGAARRLVQNRD